MPGTEGYGGGCPFCKKPNHIIKNDTSPSAFIFDACPKCGFAYGAVQGYVYSPYEVWRSIAHHRKIKSVQHLRNKLTPDNKIHDPILAGTVFDYQNESTKELSTYCSNILPISQRLDDIVVDKPYVVGRISYRSGEEKTWVCRMLKDVPLNDGWVQGTTYDSFYEKPLPYADQLHFVQRTRGSNTAPITYQAVGRRLDKNEYNSAVWSLLEHYRKNRVRQKL